jgi:Cu+-exporting ATPase
MSCEACANRVESALQRIDGVRSASVNLEDHLVSVIMERDVPFSELQEEVNEAGYALKH